MNPQEWLDLKDRALAVAAEGITIADARRPDRPLIYVNEGFERLTGYSAADALGHNCKFLQGKDTDPKTIEEIRRSLWEERDCSVEILNYRKDGTPFWNRLSITPVRDPAGEVTHYIGIQSDLTKRRIAEDGLTEANQQLAQINATMQRELEGAAEVQRAWLPDSLPEVEGFRFAWSFTPCQELGGDCLNVLQLDPDHVGVYVLDVAGHGVGAALLSATIQRSFSSVPEHSVLFTRKEGGEAYQIASPSEVVNLLNAQFPGDPGRARFFTLLYGVLNLRSRNFCYVTAGHPAPLRVGREGAEDCKHSDGVPVGLFADFDYEEVQLQLSPGDRLLLYTDGATEALSDDDDMFGTERLLAELVRQSTVDPESTLESIMDTLRRWSGSHSLDDDITMLCIDAIDDE